ncbi:hypothetical protein HanRHA438_Chr09g0388231 [Helianthus annuus]|nr:hypothetical protein HanRHA438_Chr09g0388231 [Helianthus annuus]
MASRSSCLIELASLVLFNKPEKKETLALHFKMGDCVSVTCCPPVLVFAGKLTPEREE